MKTELGISVAVLSALAAQGKVILTGSRGAKSPLKNQLSRLRELLGEPGKE